jgi:uncharacterized membrane protein YoaK (UPF0700 family)
MSELLIPSRRRLPAIVPPLLSFAAGFIDSFTVLTLFGLFVAQVTGSFVLMAVAFVKNEQGSLVKALAVPVFLLAGVTTTILAVVLERRRRAALPWILGLECAVLTGFLLTILISAPLSEAGAGSVAAAYDTACVRLRAVYPIMLGFLAGTVVGMLAYLAVGLWGLLLPLAIMYGIFAWTSASALRAEPG